jgi:DNA-binding XRE family transcriptional regulator
MAKSLPRNLRDPEKYEYAYLLYMQKVPQKEIAERVSVSPNTIVKWAKENGWEEKRAARTISMDELIAKTLRKINDMLDDDGFNADAFAKAVAQLKSLKSGVRIDDDINTFSAFSDWVINLMATDKRVTPDLFKLVTELQDAYIQHRIKAAR